MKTVKRSKSKERLKKFANNPITQKIIEDAFLKVCALSFKTSWKVKVNDLDLKK